MINKKWFTGQPVMQIISMLIAVILATYIALNYLVNFMDDGLATGAAALSGVILSFITFYVFKKTRLVVLADLIIFLKLKDPINYTDSKYDFLFKNIGAKLKFRYERNLFAAIIKRSHAAFPYQLKDYSNAKKLYDEYFQTEGHIPSFEDILNRLESGEVYITMYRSRYAMRGDRFCEYHACISSPFYDKKPKTVKCDQAKDTKYGIKIDLFSPKGYYAGCIAENNIKTYMRFATKEEIEDFKKRADKITELQEKLNYHQTEKQKLYKQIDAIGNYHT